MDAEWLKMCKSVFGELGRGIDLTIRYSLSCSGLSALEQGGVLGHQAPLDLRDLVGRAG